METQPFSRFTFNLIAVAIFTGLFLTILSWTHACTEACTAAHEFRFFGLPFEWIGVAFFSIAAIMHFLSRQYTILTDLVGILMAGAFGVETMFTVIQKYVIGSWCPLCLSIAATVGIVVIAYIASYTKNLKNLIEQKQKGKVMKQIWKSFYTSSVFIFGFLIAFAGVAKPDDAFAAGPTIQDRLEMGNKNSNIRIYFISDWFCISCKKAEPEIAKIYPAVKNQTSFYFIDLAVHKNTINYTPYHLAFLVNDKANYVEIRHELDELSYRADAPTDEQMEALAKRLGVPFHELNFREIQAGLKYFEEIAAKFNVTATPTLVIENTKTKEKAILNGTSEINLDNVQKTIEKLSK